MEIMAYVFASMFFVLATGTLGFLFWIQPQIVKLKQFETVVAKLRDKETLNEQQVELYMTAKKYDFLGYPLSAT